MTSAGEPSPIGGRLPITTAMNLRILLAFMGAVALLASTGCVTREEAQEAAVLLPGVPTSGEIVEITGREFTFESAASIVKPGKLVFVFRNGGAEMHEMAVVPFERGGYGLPVAEIEGIPPGQVEALQVALKPGAYRIVCILTSATATGSPSHLSLGMELAFEVRS